MACKEEKSCNAGGFSGENSEEEEEDCFYENLGILNQSSGLSFVFNFREALLDLHVLYKQVIKRGGFYQVTEAGKWDEVASTLNPKSFKSMSHAQLQKVYETLILQYEQMYYKMPEEANKRQDNSFLDPPVSMVSPSCLTGKRKQGDCLSPSTQIYFADPDELNVKKKISTGYTDCQGTAGFKTMDQNSTIITPPNSNGQEMRKDPDLPLKPRNGYQIFLKLECHRLKLIGEESSGNQTIRSRATQAWKCLPDIDKQAYMDASKLDKERYEREMDSYRQRANNQSTNNQCLFVNSKHESGGMPDKSMVDLAIEEMENAESNDRKFRMVWNK